MPPLSDKFTELSFWESFKNGWQHLYGNFLNLGYSIEWHDLEPKQTFDWAPSFHPGGVEICLNISGNGEVSTPQSQLKLSPLSAGFYLQNERELTGTRAGGEHHQFITIELSFAFLERHLLGQEKGLDARIASISKNKIKPQVSEPIRLTAQHQQMIASLRQPPVYAPAQRLWYHAKALEIASALFFHPENEEELFCNRQKRQNQDRVDRVISLLQENLAESLSLEEIGRRVGCSHFHLSRIFTQETGKSIFQYLRQLRLERAAEYLREGKMNVTQVALEVGYSSPSHFSTAFHEAYGCCPGLYPSPVAGHQAKVSKRPLKSVSL